MSVSPFPSTGTSPGHPSGGGGVVVGSIGREGGVAAAGGMCWEG